MLIIKIFLDDNQIDEVQVENIGKFDDLFEYQSKKRPKLYVYKIVEPKGFENKTIVHTQKQGHRVLISKAMELIKHSRRIQWQRNQSIFIEET